MAGYSPELRQFMRVYPTDVLSGIKAREILSLELVRNCKDSRSESWTLKTRDMDSVKKSDECVSKTELEKILESNLSESIQDLNENKKSLGVIKPKDFRIIIKSRESVQDPMQKLLFDDFEKEDSFKTATDYYLSPYIVIDEFDGQKCFQLREWGCYELIRKNDRISASDIKKALHIHENTDVYFVVGNINQHRKIWIVIKVFVFKNSKQMSLFK
jgi:hypothetical protein